jgi:hypothetical protein
MTANTDTLRSHVVRPGFLLTNRAAAELAPVLNRDAASDVEVVSRETRLSAAMLERLRHALECLELAATVLASTGDARASAHADAEAVKREVVDRQMAEREVLETMEAHVLA